MTTTRSQATDAVVAGPDMKAPKVWSHMIESGLIVGVAVFLFALTKIGAIPAAILTAVIAWPLGAGIAIRSADTPVSIYMIAAGLMAPAWMAYAKLAGVWHWPAIVSLVAVTVLLMVAGGMVWERHAAENRRADASAAAYAAAAVLRNIDSCFAKIGYPKVRATRIDSGRAGREIHLRLPDDGSVTLSTLRTLAERLSASLKMDAAAISFEGGSHGGQAVMVLDDTDVFDETIPFPEHQEWLDINKPIAVGMAALGEIGYLLFQEVATFLTGIRGWGKTNLLNVLIAQFSSCTNVVIWCIDLGGGGLAAPWVQPWVDDQILGDGTTCPRPVIDWIATTRGEAYEMFKAADRLITARREGLTRRMKIIPNRGKPAVILLGDEVATIFMQDGVREKQKMAEVSNIQMVAWANDITRLGRPAAVDPIWTTQRGTASMAGSMDLKSQCGQRIALGQAAEMDARAAVPDSEAAVKAISQLRHKGTGLIWLMGDPQKPKRLRVWKFFRLDTSVDEDHAKVTRIATRNSSAYIRASFDAADLAALGEPYTNRWENSELFRRIAPEPPAAAEQPAAAPGTTATAVVDRDAEKRAQLDMFDSMVSKDPELSGLKNFAGGFTAHGDMPPWRMRAHAIIAEKRIMGVATGEIRIQLKKEGFLNPQTNQPYTRETISRALAKDRDAGLISSKHDRWYPPMDIPPQP
jgi:hypothetical protein